MKSIFLLGLLLCGCQTVSSSNQSVATENAKNQPVRSNFFEIQADNGFASCKDSGADCPDIDWSNGICCSGWCQFYRCL